MRVTMSTWIAFESRRLNEKLSVIVRYFTAMVLFDYIFLSFKKMCVLNTLQYCLLPRFFSLKESPL